MRHHALYCSSNMSTLPSIFFLGSCLPGKYSLCHLSTCVPYSCRRKMLLFKRMQRPQVFIPEDGLLHHRLPAQGTWIPAQPKSQLLAYIYVYIYQSQRPSGNLALKRGNKHMVFRWCKQQRGPQTCDVMRRLCHGSGVSLVVNHLCLG